MLLSVIGIDDSLWKCIMLLLLFLGTETMLTQFTWRFHLKSSADSEGLNVLVDPFVSVLPGYNTAVFLTLLFLSNYPLTGLLEYFEFIVNV